MQDGAERAWREEFERLGEMQVYDNVRQGAIYNDETKRQAAFRWLGEVAAARRAREARSYNYVQWTFYAAVAAGIVGVIGIIVTLMR